jgi:hypothetical protein
MGEPGRIRTKKIHVYLTDIELGLLHDKSAYLGINMSEYIRLQITDGFIINYQTALLKELIISINRIGTNINQIARHANEIGMVSDSEHMELKNLYGELLDNYIMFAVKESVPL